MIIWKRKHNMRCIEREWWLTCLILWKILRVLYIRLWWCLKWVLPTLMTFHSCTFSPFCYFKCFNFLYTLWACTWHQSMEKEMKIQKAFLSLWLWGYTTQSYFRLSFHIPYFWHGQEGRKKLIKFFICMTFHLVNLKKSSLIIWIKKNSSV